MKFFERLKKFKRLYACAMAFLAVSLVGASVYATCVVSEAPDAVSVCSMDIPERKGLADSGFVPASYPYSVSYVYLPERFRPLSGSPFYLDMNDVDWLKLETYDEDGDEINYDYGYFGERVFTLDLSRINLDLIDAWSLALRYKNSTIYLNEQFFSVSSPAYSVSSCLADRVVYFGGRLSNDSAPVDYVAGVYEASAKFDFGDIGYYFERQSISSAPYWFAGVLDRLFSSGNYTHPLPNVYSPVNLTGLDYSGLWLFDGGVYNFMSVDVTVVSGNTAKYVSQDDFANMPRPDGINYYQNWDALLGVWYAQLPTMPDSFVNRVYFYGEAGELEFYKLDVVNLYGKSVYMAKMIYSDELPATINVVASKSTSILSTSANPNFFDLFVRPFKVVNNVSDINPTEFTFVRNIPFVGVRDYSDTGEAFLSVFELFSMAFTAFAGLFSMSVAGGLTFGVLLFLPLVVLILITLIRLLRG